MTMRFGVFALIGVLVAACSDNQEVDCELSDLELNISGNEGADCNIGASIVLDAAGGEPPYIYRFDGSPFQDLTTFEGVNLGGPYIATVQDAQGCEVNVEVNVSGDENTVDFEAATTNAGCGSSEGGITITASGGDGDFDYRIGNGTFGDISSFNDLEAGEYSISVRDGTGCINVKGIKVLSGISYESEVKPIIIESCATTDCHVSGTGRSNLTIFSNVKNNAASIKTRVLNGSMPKNSSLSAAEIEAIVCWVDDGALDN